MRAQNREDYVAAWRSHCRELVQLALAADVPLAEYEALQEQLGGWIERGANHQNLPEVSA